MKPNDNGIHGVVGQTPVKVLLLWAPAGEVERLARAFRQRPLRGTRDGLNQSLRRERH